MPGGLSGKSCARRIVLAEPRLLFSPPALLSARFVEKSETVDYRMLFSRQRSSIVGVLIVGTKNDAAFLSNLPFRASKK